MNIPRSNILILLSALLVCATPSALALPNSVGQGLDRQIGRDVEREIEREVARGVERDVEKRVDRDVGKQLGKQVERQAERAVGKQVDSQVKAAVNRHPGIGPNALPEAALNGPERQLKRGPPQGLDKPGIAAGKAKPPGVSNSQSRPTGQGEPLHRPYPAARYHRAIEDAHGHAYLENQLLVMVDEATVQALTENGIGIQNRTRLPSLGKVLLELDANQAEALNQLSATAMGKIKDAKALNHLYRYQNSDLPATEDGAGWMPDQAMRLESGSGHSPGIGLIDSHIDTSHDVFIRSSVLSENFLEDGLTAVTNHGTAVASVLVGKSETFAGLLPNAKLYGAGVFYHSDALGQAASTKSILLAIDWLLGNGVDVINMSLAGPPNPLLEAALARAIEQEVLIVAAAGNGGPAAANAYPAAYPGVIAVTAVNRDNLVYYRSNRGSYIDFSAPGVGIAHADARGSYAKSSGTSFAAPFVTATAASLMRSIGAPEAVANMRSFALDLGEPDFDPVYGHGLIQSPANATAGYK